MNWQDYTSTPLWNQSDDAEKEHLRYRYWKDYLAPNIPEEHHREARTLFDQHTRRRGNPESNYAGDLWDALWHGGYAGVADLVSGASRLVGGNGHNAAGDWLREKSEEQLDNMSPSSVEAMQGFGIERKADGGYGLTDGSTAAGFGLQFASGLGSLTPSMIPGGVASKGLAALGAKGLQATGAAAGVKGLADARRLQGYANAIDKASHAIGYGTTGGLMIGGAGAEDAKNAVLSASYEQLKDSPRFQELYQQTYEAAGGGDTRVPFEQAKALLAEEAAKEAFAPAAGVGAVSMGIAGPIMEGLALGATGSRGANALKGLITEGTQEFGEGYGQQVAANYGQQQVGIDVGFTDRAMDQALTGLAVGGPVGGVVGGFGRTRNSEAVSILQNKLNDLMSQHQTLQDQMQEPHADQTMLAEQLRQNSLAIAGLESQLRELGENIQQPEQPQLEAGAQPESEGGPQWYNWSDRNDPNNPPRGAGGGVSDNPNAGPQDFSDYDRPAWQRNQPDNPAEAVRFGQRYVDTAEPTSNLEQPSQWNGRSVGLEGQSPINTPMDTRNVGMSEQEVQQPTPQDNLWKNRTVTREKSQPAEPQQQSLPYYPPADFTGNRYGTVDSDPEAAKQDSQQRRAEQLDRAASQHPGSPKYTGNPDQDLASYTERMNSLNRLFRSFNWQRGDEGKKRRVRKLIENQRRLEMKARKSGRGITPTSMKEALANLKAMVESGEGIRFEREVSAIENRQQQEGLRLTAQEKSGTPSGIKPVMGRGKEKVSTAERELDTQYALYEADDLIASHNDTGKINPDYPAELQPRDRTRQASEDQIRGIASKLNPKLLGANPLAMAAPHFARAKGIDPELGGYGVIESLVEASRILQDSRNRNQSVDEILDQHSLLDNFSPETELFARWLNANLHKSKQVGQALSELANQIEQYLQKQSQADGDMFGTAEATLDDLINQTNNQLEKNYGDKSTPIKDPKRQKAEPVQTAEGSDRSSKPEERSGRPTDDTSGTKREVQRDEVDDLLDAVDDGTLDSDEWTDDDFAGIEEDKTTYDPQDGGSATKRRERDWYNSRNAPHYSVPGFKSLGGAERAAIKRYLDGRQDKQGIVQRLKKLADTPWARKTVQSMLIRQTIDDLIAGREVDYRSLLSQRDNASMLKDLKAEGEAGLWRYLHREDLLGHAGKPENSINGSFVDCLPSRDCASFCYATKGNYRFSNPIIKSELVSWAVENHPVKAASIAANDYKGTPAFYQNKALRLFDMGDGSLAWLPFIKEMNKEGIRLQIFSKNPEFLKQVPELNWRALSVDNSNFELAAQQPDLSLAVVFDGQQSGIDFIRSNLDRILVILPIKHGQKVLADKATLRRMLGLDAMKRVCPVDGGWKKIKHPTDPKKNFNCTSCDKYGGMGCFHGNVTSQVMKAATVAPHEKNLQRLKEEIENDPEKFGGKESAAELLGNLGKIRSALRASADPRAEETDAGGQGQETEGTIGLRQIDERTGRYRVGENEEGEIGERKRRPKKKDLEAAGQKDLFASPDLSGDERKQQIIEDQRVLVKHVETGNIKAGTDTLNDVRDVGHFIAPIRKLAQEEMYAIVLDGNNKVINVIKHSKGQKSSASVSPWTLAGAIVATPEAKSVWFAHSHPSGDPFPSAADQGVTVRLNEVLDGSGVVNNGHVVVGVGKSFRALDADGLHQGSYQAKTLPRKQTFAVTERQLRMNRPRYNLGSPDAARNIADLAQSPNAIILLNTNHDVTGILSLSENDLETLRHPTSDPQGWGKSHQAPGARLGNPAAARIMAALDRYQQHQGIAEN